MMADDDTGALKRGESGPAWSMAVGRFNQIDTAIYQLHQKVDKLSEHVNDERDDMLVLIGTKVEKGSVLSDLLNAVKTSRLTQFVLVATALAIGPVVLDHWDIIFTRFSA